MRWWWWLCWAVTAVVVAGAGPGCRVSEYPCSSGSCVALDRFCDSRGDCPDESDEPQHCTPCNRTYYGDVGRTYEIEIRRPREDKIPFICHLNFTAGGGDLGDLIQLTFDTFTVGRFVSFTSDGCPDGHMTIREADRPATGGQWCGSAWGYTVYYSETRSLNLTLRLDRISQVGGYNFDFKLAYKVLRRGEAHLRYGNRTAASWRGELIRGSYCDRVLAGCDQRPCRIQSPNYPGVYPRNVTCYYRIEHRAVPRGKHALLAVRQRNSHKIHIKDQVVKYDRSQRVLRVWDQCNVVQDYLTVYDGGSTTDPVLVRLCGGDAVPDIVSSGSSMLLEFHTSPYDNPFHPVPLSFLPGFELEVQVLFVDSGSQSYVRDVQHCEIVVTAFDQPWGLLENPRHSLPPNTTCRYHLQGRRDEQVWISFVKYHAAPADPAAYQLSADCNARLRIWDGRISSLPGVQSNVSLLGDFCKDDVPRLCDHTLLSNSSRFTRPCSLEESYVSSGSELTLEQTLTQGSVLFPLDFLLRYEFVNVAAEGSPGPGLCDRRFTAGSGRFQSPRSVFLYGRGGAANLSCLFRFEPGPTERVRLTLSRARFAERPCATADDPRTGRRRCDAVGGGIGTAELWVAEYPWSGVQLPRHCICSRLQAPLSVLSLVGSALELNFTVTLMNITQDFRDFYFEGEYEFVPEPAQEQVELCKSLRRERRLKGSSGEVAYPGRSTEGPGAERLRSPPPAPDCEHHPWLVEPEDDRNNFLYLQVSGFELEGRTATADCGSRVAVYTGLEPRRPRVVCAAESGPGVRVFSGGWNRSAAEAVLHPGSKRLLLELLPAPTRARAAFTWIEVSRRPAAPSSFLLSSATNANIDCPYRCPEINACIRNELWCDGTRHCPSGYDEQESNCAFQFGVPVLYVAIGAGALLVLSLLIATTACFKCRQLARRRAKPRPRPPPPLPRYPGSELYLDAKDGALC